MTAASYRNIIVTGGAGFVGSHLVEALAKAYPTATIRILDKMTYAASARYVAHLIGFGVMLDVVDVADFDAVLRVMKDADLVVHAAAESHVDRSFGDSLLFTRSNVLGTHVVLEAARQAKVPRVIHVSTDEVYGEVLDGEANERSPFDPTSPYAASKAAAEMIVNAYRHSFKTPIIVVRANNIYGARQFPEKLIPRAIMSVLSGEAIPLHGDGSNVRHYLSAHDFAEAIVLLAERGVIGETYNVGAQVSYSNRDVARMICDHLGVPFESAVSFVTDRPFNDRRYAVSSEKLMALGWLPRRSLADDLDDIVEWYRDNAGELRHRMAVEAADLAAGLYVSHVPHAAMIADMSTGSLHL